MSVVANNLISRSAMKQVALFIFVMLLGFEAALASTAQRADSAYNAEDYRMATELYQAAIDSEGPSAELYYNLANAFYRAGKPGLAVLNYERSLRIDPTDADARQNLEFVRNHIQDRPEDDTAFFASLHRSMVMMMRPDAWAWTAFALFVLLTGAVALYIFSADVTRRKFGFFGGIILLVFFVYAIIAAADAAARARDHNEAVVVVPSTQLSSAPRAVGTSADRTVNIHEGTVVEIIDSVHTPDDPVSPMWYNVKINNATKAWLRSIDVERI